MDLFSHLYFAKKPFISIVFFFSKILAVLVSFLFIYLFFTLQYCIDFAIHQHASCVHPWWMHVDEIITFKTTSAAMILLFSSVEQKHKLGHLVDF